MPLHVRFKILFILISFISCSVRLRGWGLSFYIVVIWNFEKRMDGIRGIRGSGLKASG